MEGRREGESKAVGNKNKGRIREERKKEGREKERRSE